jgi:uncharacterized protein (TIGR03086 family)
MYDLRPAAQRMAALLDGVRDAQLTAPTPCPDYLLGDLIHHVDGLSVAFAAAAVKDLGPATSAGPAADAGQLGEDWRARIRGQLLALAEAWREPSAWEGMSRVGGIDLPGEVIGRVAIDELVVHGWDVAVASGQPYDADPDSIKAAMEFAATVAEPGADRRGLFGPIIDIPADAPELDRLLGLTGRDPKWA